MSADGTIAVDLDLPDALRTELAKPFGPVLAEEDLPGHLRGCRKMYAIGDMTGISLIRIGISPDLMIYDLKTERGPCDEDSKNLIRKTEGSNIKVTNPAGKLTSDLWNAVAKAVKSDKKTKIEVEGEEDLASLACIALGEMGDCVIYGIPNEGITVIRIDEDIKNMVSGILSRMHSDTKR